MNDYFILYFILYTLFLHTLLFIVYEKFFYFKWEVKLEIIQLHLYAGSICIYIRMYEINLLNKYLFIDFY